MKNKSGKSLPSLGMGSGKGKSGQAGKFGGNATKGTGQFANGTKGGKG